MIAIIGALPEEVQALQQQIKEPQITECGSRRFVRGKLAGGDVVVTVSGVGKVNAASAAQQVIDLFRPKAVINSGIAGGLDEKLSLGDIVISRDAVQHDVDTTVFGEEPGQIPDMDVWQFPADEELIDAAVAAGVKAEADSEFRGEVHIGRILSGDIFLTDEAKKRALREVFDGTCVEMEGAAIAQVAWLNQVPWVISRCISDQADDPDVTDYFAFKQEAIAISVKMVMTMLQEYHTE